MSTFPSFIAFTFLFKGNDSTASALGSAVKILAFDRHDLQRYLREHLEDIPAFVEEVLRTESPFKCHYRVLQVGAFYACNMFVWLLRSHIQQ